MAPFLSDLFTDTDDTKLEDHTPDTGGAWSRLTSKVINIGSDSASTTSSNELITRNANRTSNDYRNAADPGGADYSVAFDLLGARPNNSRAQYYALGRMSPSPAASNAEVDCYFGGFAWGGSWDGISGDSWIIGKRVSETVTILGSSAAPATFGVNVDLIMDGTTISLEVDATEEVSVTDSGVSQTGRAGIGIGDNDGVSADNLSAEELAAGGGGAPTPTHVIYNDAWQGAV